jgi:hypothetical protein
LFVTFRAIFIKGDSQKKKKKKKKYFLGSVRAQIMLGMGRDRGSSYCGGS